jgi:calcium-dependent protein kinase
MGQYIDKVCPIWNRTNTNNSLNQDLLEEYRSNSTVDMNVKNLTELKIKPSTFIRERYCLPNTFYDNLGMINEGSYGMVIKVKQNMMNEERAMKIIKKSTITFKINEDDLFDEIKILKSLDHPNIIKIYEFFKDSINYYIVTEYLEEGDLYNKLLNIKFFNENVVAHIMKQIFSAVSYLHSKNIIHGDLKCDNILIDSSIYKDISFQTKRDRLFDIKLIDFGCSRYLKGTDKTFSGLIGTTFYMAPEVIKNSYNHMCDIWACGVIMYLLLTGTPPFYGYTDEETLEQINKGYYSMDHPAFKNVSDEAKDLIKRLLTYDHEKRPTARQALNHPWFKYVQNSSVVDNIDPEYSKTVLNSLKTFNAEQKFQQAVVTFITHNLIKKEEVKHLKKIFQFLDKDNDGRISKLELNNAFKDVFGTVLADLELNNIMKTIDHDNNGFIEYEEFLRATVDRNLLLSETNLLSAFDIFDINKDGTISSEEIKNIIGGGKHIPDNVIIELLAEIDKKADEEICYDEFKNIMNKIVK